MAPWASDVWALTFKRSATGPEVEWKIAYGVVFSSEIGQYFRRRRFCCVGAGETLRLVIINKQFSRCQRCLLESVIRERDQAALESNTVCVADVGVEMDGGIAKNEPQRAHRKFKGSVVGRVNECWEEIWAWGGRRGQEKKKEVDKKEMFEREVIPMLHTLQAKDCL